MSLRRFDRVLLSSILIVAVTAILLVILAVLTTHPNQSQTTVEIKSAAMAPSLPTTTTTAAVTQPAATTYNNLPLLQPDLSAPSLYLIDSSHLQVGNEIMLPSPLLAKGNVSLLHTDKAAHLTIDQVVGLNNPAWNKGGLWNGKQITATLSFGLGALGSYGVDGKWYPSINMPELNCTNIRKCVLTGKTLTHIENQPMWIADYDGLQFCGTGYCYSHSVYIINDDNGVMYYSFGYDPE